MHSIASVRSSSGAADYFANDNYYSADEHAEAGVWGGEGARALGLEGQVAVYVPFSYSVAGHIVIMPADRVEPLAADAADAMAFIVSGGVTRTASSRPASPA